MLYAAQYNAKGCLVDRLKARGKAALILVIINLGIGQRMIDRSTKLYIAFI